MLDAKDLFPKGTVILNGIKTFGGQRIDEAILDATALMYTVGGPLSDLFDQIIKSHRDMLPKIENPTYEDNKGVIGWASGRRILIGNRDLMPVSYTHLESTLILQTAILAASRSISSGMPIASGICPPYWLTICTNSGITEDAPWSTIGKPGRRFATSCRMSRRSFGFWPGLNL